MELKKQVTSLEISKRLKELGVRQESLFYYGRADAKSELNLGGIPTKYNGNWMGEISAFTVAELGEMLPIHFTKETKKGIIFEKHLFFSKQPNGYAIWYGQNYFDNIGYQVEKSEANARGKMLIYLLENSLLPLSSESNEPK